MASSVFITRVGTGDGQRIELGEWQSYWQTRPEFTAQDELQLTSPGGIVIRIPTPDGVLWTAHPDGQPRSFLWQQRRGEVTFENPDEATLDKAREIARVLGALVVGEEGEEY